APTRPAVRRELRPQEGPGRGGRVEHPRPRAGRRRVHAGHPLAQPRRVPRGPGGGGRLPDPQVAARAGLRAAQVAVGVHRRPHRRALPVRVARRRRPVVAQPRQRELGVRRRGLHAAAGGLHQRRGDRGVAAAHLRRPWRGRARRRAAAAL
ncbi:MAG: COGs COG3558, partial [uncultured Frankineae bacterium]